MHKTNFNNEMFHDNEKSLLKELNRITNRLKFQLLNKRHFLKVTDIIKNKYFNSCWPNIIPNSKGKNDKINRYMGIYAFAQVKNKKLYVKYIGISRNINTRFSYHAKRYSTSSSSWLNLMLKPHFTKLDSNNADKRKKLIKKIQKLEIHSCRFTFVPVDDNMILHMAEIYAVNKLHSFYNSFRTH